MLSIPIDDAIAKIAQKANISTNEVNSKIESKLNQLSGLVSKEGAAYIVANELGVKLFEETGGKLAINKILAGMRDVETVGKVIQKFDVRQFNTNGREGKVGNFIIGDETGTIRIVSWGTLADMLSKFNVGDVVKVKSSYIKENNGAKEMHLNDRSEIIINPEGVSINNVAEMTRPKAVRKDIVNLNETDTNVELFGTVVQSFEPRFFEVCPTCGKRARPTEGNFICPEHQAVTPDYSYVMNATLDDGTETIRTVFFRESAEKLLNKTKSDILNYRLNPAEFDIVKNELLGKQVKLIGKTTKNTMFDRLEFIANDVDTNPDPKQEIEKLQNQG